jgi:hypothetical protein
MLAIHDQQNQVTRHMRNRLKTTGMGLGLVRLLMDAGLTSEARTTLASLGRWFPRRCSNNAKVYKPNP